MRGLLGLNSAGMKYLIHHGVALSIAITLLTQGTGSAEESPLSLKAAGRLRAEQPLFQSGPFYFSAASGLVRHGKHFYVVADDAQVLGYFRWGRPARVINILQRPPLPANSSLRAKVKPDFEALTLLESGPEASLLAVCSGSGEYRDSAVYLPLSQDGRPKARVEIDLKPLYDKLRERFSQLNVEGVSVVKDRVRLLQRGNSSKDPNAIIDLDLEAFLRAVKKEQRISPDIVREIKEIDLGTTAGSDGPVRWTFTDLCPLEDGRSVFTAAAEDTDNPYEDGEILGSAIGVLELDGTISSFRRVKQKIKLEGVAVKGRMLYLVTDADDPKNAAVLYKVKLP